MGLGFILKEVTKLSDMGTWNMENGSSAEASVSGARGRDRSRGAGISGSSEFRRQILLQFPSLWLFLSSLNSVILGLVILKIEIQILFLNRNGNTVKAVRIE